MSAREILESAINDIQRLLPLQQAREVSTLIIQLDTVALERLISHQQEIEKYDTHDEERQAQQMQFQVQGLVRAFTQLTNFDTQTNTQWNTLSRNLQREINAAHNQPGFSQAVGNNIAGSQHPLLQALSQQITQGLTNQQQALVGQLQILQAVQQQLANQLTNNLPLQINNREPTIEDILHYRRQAEILINEYHLHRTRLTQAEERLNYIGEYLEARYLQLPNDESYFNSLGSYLRNVTRHVRRIHNTPVDRRQQDAAINRSSELDNTAFVNDRQNLVQSIETETAQMNAQRQQAGQLLPDSHDHDRSQSSLVTGKKRRR